MTQVITIKEDTYLVGDVHGKILSLINNLQSNQLAGSSFILLGDVGIGFDAKDEQKLHHCDVLLQNTGNHFYLIRGNHDNPRCWQDSAWLIPFENIHFVNDGQQLIIGSKRYVAFGGAISVDRCTRTLGLDYWNGEAFVPPKSRIKDIQGVLAHTGPFAQGWGSIMSYIVRDVALRHDLAKEQDDILDTIKLLRPEQWFCGHFHISENTCVENTLCRCLNIDEIVPLFKV